MTIQMITIIMMMKMTPPLRQSLSEVQTIGSPLVKVAPLALPDQDEHGDVFDDDGVDDDYVYDDDGVDDDDDNLIFYQVIQANKVIDLVDLIVSCLQAGQGGQA